MLKLPLEETAALVDVYPLRPHLAVRTAGTLDSQCAECALPATFVLLEIDVAADPPRFADDRSRVCYQWDHMLVGCCDLCLPGVLRRFESAFSTS